MRGHCDRLAGSDADTVTDWPRVTQRGPQLLITGQLLEIDDGCIPIGNANCSPVLLLFRPLMLVRVIDRPPSQFEDSVRGAGAAGELPNPKEYSTLIYKGIEYTGLTLALLPNPFVFLRHRKPPFPAFTRERFRSKAGGVIREGEKKTEDSKESRDFHSEAGVPYKRTAGVSEGFRDIFARATYRDSHAVCFPLPSWGQAGEIVLQSHHFLFTVVTDPGHIDNKSKGPNSVSYIY